MVAATADFKNGVNFTGITNGGTVGPFTLLGGKYGVAVYSSGTASATLYIAVNDAPDGGGTDQFVAVGSAVTSYSSFDLPAGKFQLVAGGAASTMAGVVSPLPYRPNAG